MQPTIARPAGGATKQHATSERATRFLRARIPVAWLQLGLLLATVGAIPLWKHVDNDFWWHLRAGRFVFESGIPRHDPFSWTAGGRPWVAHEWLSEAIIYALDATVGYAANVVLFSLASVAALALMYALARRSGAGTRPLVALAIVSSVIFAVFVTVRPQVFTWLLFALFFYVLQRDDDGDRTPLWILPPLMALWANLHLGFVYGLVLVAAWAGARVLDRVRGRARDLREATLVGLACLVAAMLNPHGPAILWYPARYLFDAGVTRSTVNEWRAPDITMPFHAPIFIAAALLAMALLSRTRPRPFAFMVTVAVIVLSMQAVRNAPFAALLLMPVAGAAAAARWEGASSARDSGLRVSAALSTALVAGVAAAAGVAGVTSGGDVSLWRASQADYPHAGADFVASRYADRRVFNEYGAGGYLIDRWYPRTPVFIDGRTDFYGDALLQDYLTVYRVGPGWDDVLARYDVEVALIPAASKLAGALRADGRWTEEFVGSKEAVFVRH